MLTRFGRLPWTLRCAPMRVWTIQVPVWEQGTNPIQSNVCPVTGDIAASCGSWGLVCPNALFVLFEASTFSTCANFEPHWPKKSTHPIGSMYGIFTYIWFIFMVNVGKYTIHGSFGHEPRCQKRPAVTAEKAILAAWQWSGHSGSFASWKLKIEKDALICPFTSWWFQPIWKILVNLDHFPG